MTNSLARWTFAAAAALAWACGPSAPAEAPEPAAPLSGPALDGRTVALADYKGKVVLVDFWATWCDPCRAEIPELVKLQAAYGARGFAVVGVSMDDEPKAVAPFVKRMGVDYPVILNGGERPPKGWIVPGLPTAYLIGRDGTALSRQFGSKSFRKLSADIEAALAK